MTDVSKRDLAKFGIAVGAVFAGLGAWLLLRSDGQSWAGFVFAILGTGLLLFGLAAPAALRPAHRAWMVFAHALGWVNTRILLGVLFYVLFVLGRLYLLISRKDPMKRRPVNSRKTYWEDVSTPEPEPASYEHTF